MQEKEGLRKIAGDHRKQLDVFLKEGGDTTGREGAAALACCCLLGKTEEEKGSSVSGLNNRTLLTIAWVTSCLGEAMLQGYTTSYLVLDQGTVIGTELGPDRGSSWETVKPGGVNSKAVVIASRRCRPRLASERKWFSKKKKVPKKRMPDFFGAKNPEPRIALS